MRPLAMQPIILRCNLLLLLALSACVTRRTLTFTPDPPDAVVNIDGHANSAGSVTQMIGFRGPKDLHTVTATRLGYQDLSVILDRKTPSPVLLQMRPMERDLTFLVTPVPAVVSIDGAPAADTPVKQVEKVLEFKTDEHDQWTQYTVTASRPGFATAKVIVSETTPAGDTINLQLQPVRKDISIVTDPPGASVSIEGQTIGATPLVDHGRAFAFDVDTNQYAVQHLRITKAGYDPLETTISWDDGRAEYRFDVPAKHKTVRFNTDPAGATVTINGKALPPGPDGAPTAPLVFTPVNAKGDLPTFTATISKKTAETEWISQTLPIAWDDGQTDYSATLKEVKTRPVPLLAIDMQRNADGVWEIIPVETQTLGMKDISEGPGKEPPALLYSAPRGTTISNLTVSPTGNMVLFATLTGNSKADLRSQILAIASDATGGVQQITDGKSLDIMPSFTPDGEQIVYCSNRAGRKLTVWRKSVVGGAGLEQLTTGDEQDLWPMIDAGPHPRLFYEVLSDSLADGQLYMSPVDGGPRSDLTTISVSQPRISPKADSIVFTNVNVRTGNREIYRVPDRGGPPVNLTNDPDSDCYDPTWSKDGNLIAYVCDRGLDEDRHRNADIWILDLNHPDKPVQVTTNGSVYDCPAFDPVGSAIYFRSNRGGQWGVWKISLK